MNIKITDEQFLELFYEQNGDYTNTAKAIARKYGVAYTRQAVYKRAKNFPEEVQELWLNNHKPKLLPFAEDEGNDIRLRVRIYMHLLDKLTRYQLRRIAAEAKAPVPHYEAKPVDLSDRLLVLAKENESLQKNAIS